MFTLKKALLNRADGVDFQKIHKIAQRTNRNKTFELTISFTLLPHHYILGNDSKFNKQYWPCSTLSC